MQLQNLSKNGQVMTHRYCTDIDARSKREDNDSNIEYWKTPEMETPGFSVLAALDHNAVQSKGAVSQQAANSKVAE